MLSRVVRFSFKFGKTIQSLGSALFNATTAMLFYLMLEPNENEEDALKNQYILAAGSVALIANLIVVYRTRLPAIDKAIDELDSSSCCSQCGCSPCKYIGCNREACGNFIGLIPKISVRSSILWTSINTILFISKFEYFCQNILHIDPNSDAAKYSKIAFTAYIALCSLISYISLTLKKTDKNSDELANKIKSALWSLDKDARKTLILVLLNSIPTLRFAYYSTKKSLHKLPFLEDVPDEDLDLPAIISTVSAFLTGIMSTNGQIYKFLNEESEIKWLDPVNIANMIDSGFVASANMAGMAYASSNPYSWQTLISSGIFGLIAGWVSYVFNNEAHEDILAYEKMRKAKLARHSTVHVAEHKISIASERKMDVRTTTSKPSDIDREINVRYIDTNPLSMSPEKYYKRNWTPTQFKKSERLVELSKPLLVISEPAPLSP